MNTYEVTVIESEGGPDPAMRQRLATCAAFRLASLERRTGHYPQAGGEFDMLDNFSGKFLWERDDEEVAQDPPSRVDYAIIAVDPLAAPEAGQTVRVTVSIVF